MVRNSCLHLRNLIIAVSIMSNDNIPEERFQGREFVEKEEDFNEALHEIELANLEFFQSQEPHDENEKHARLHDYYFVYTLNGTITLTFLPERDLRNDIKQAVIKAFTSIYTVPNDSK
jgi:hypothetical protein